MSEDKKGSTTTGTEAPFPSWPSASGKRPQSGIQAGLGTPSGGSNPDFFAGQELCGYTIKRKLAEGRTGVGSQAPRGGPVATAGGLLFVGTAGDRTFRARDSATGKVLWEHKLDAATEGVPAVYQAGGREYVTLPVGGDGLFAQRGNPAPGPSRYVTFALPAR